MSIRASLASLLQAITASTVLIHCITVKFKMG